ncbi:cytochrome c oxidase subunit 3 [Devosia sp. ZB163]|uniref:cytochrome c oxidase subunit 3 n=1 Tax=Devosia sp. ZB163 TaxID=3025938 RepID=UPI002361EFF4|nr:cytochrome c oxidase subunit 3 [Devosia sp. ZB163]MDC9823629.1 cytochrome c oxidase subunit 3 [Devosia sp. ZB163]
MAAHAKNHDYHLVSPSPWPIIGSISVFVMAAGAVLWFHDIMPPWLLLAGTVGVLYTMYGWWSDVIKEGKAGDHTPVVQMHHRYGMILFITSEVMFFVAWFWAYFDAFFNHDAPEQYARIEAMGASWPPIGVELFNPWHLPLFNTLILLTSGTAVTWAHHALLHRDKRGLVWGLAITIALGVLFTFVQALEYSEAAFSFSGNIYGASFFMATGFHGFHVLVGTIFLIVCLIRAQRDEFTPKNHLGFEFAAWYWHFVDVVWLFLFASIYVWGSWGVTLTAH